VNISVPIYAYRLKGQWESSVASQAESLRPMFILHYWHKMCSGIREFSYWTLLRILWQYTSLMLWHSPLFPMRSLTLKMTW